MKPLTHDCEIASKVSRSKPVCKYHRRGHSETFGIRAFQRIEKFVLEQDQVTLFQRIAKRASIEADVRKFTGDLDFAMRMFQVTYVHSSPPAVAHNTTLLDWLTNPH